LGAALAAFTDPAREDPHPSGRGSKSGCHPQVDPLGKTPHNPPARRPGGRCEGAEESPGSTRTRCRLTAGGGDPRESATENKPPSFGWVRVKRCGKSAPRPWQQGRQGKPHREQDRIGVAGERNLVTPGGVAQGRSRPVTRVGRTRRAATRVAEEWPSRALAFERMGVRTEPGLQAVWQLFLTQ